MWHEFKAHIAGRVQSLHCKTWSGPILGAVMRRGPCGEECPGLILSDVFEADVVSRAEPRVVRRVRGPPRRNTIAEYSGPMVWDVLRAYVVGRVQSPCYGTSSGPMLWELFETHDVRLADSILHQQGLRTRPTTWARKISHNVSPRFDGRCCWKRAG